MEQASRAMEVLFNIATGLFLFFYLFVSVRGSVIAVPHSIAY
jgi:hypothetical protein